MATVRLSKGLHDSVRGRIHQMFSKRIEAADAAIPELSSDVAYEKGFTEQERLALSKAPKGWFPTCSQFHAIFINKTGEKLRMGGKHKNAQSIKTVTRSGIDHPVPYDRKSYNGTTVYIYDEVLFNTFNMAILKVDSIEQEKQLLLETVDKLFKKYSTYRQVLKVWPQIEHLVPDEVHERHLEATTSRNRTDDGEDIETLNEASNALLKNKLLS